MSSETCRKRVTVKMICPNPLFEKWLTEWKNEAKEKNSKTQHAYNLALQSLRKYPLPLETGRDCKILKGFGNKLCELLDEKLRRYRNEGKNNNISKRIQIDADVTSTPNKKCKKGNQEYIPTYRSGPYAIILTMYKSTLEENHQGFMYKKDLIRAAQPLCEVSFSKAEPGSFYTAWNSMKTLLSKNLVKKESNPAKYSLTDEGILLGHKLYTNKISTRESSPIYSSSREKVDIDKTLEQLFLEKHSEPSNGTSECNGQFGEVGKISNFQIPTGVIPASSELKDICGIFSSNVLEKNEGQANKKESMKPDSEHQDIILSPHSFEIILYVDTQETSGGQVNPEDDPILAELRHLAVNYEVKNLKVGDYCWICRDRVSGVELVAPYIIERKRMDDLAKSIKDGRFHEQKFRLKECGLQNIIYMIESFGKNDEHVGLPINSLYQATVNTLIQDGFCVKFVDGVRGVAEYLSCMSNLIKKNYEIKTLVSCVKENLVDISFTDDLVSLMPFAEFNRLSLKTKSFTVKEMFIRQLLQIKGLAVDKALAIVEAYPTPQILKNAFAEDVQAVNVISNIKYGKLGKKIGPSLANIIYELFTKVAF